MFNGHHDTSNMIMKTSGMYSAYSVIQCS